MDARGWCIVVARSSGPEDTLLKFPPTLAQLVLQALLLAAPGLAASWA
jgi:hypothetical protein